MNLPARPRVTVYVPVRDYGRFLRQCLDSVLAQSLDDWELIVIDDGSEDGSAEIAESYQARDPERISVLRNPQPLGLRACANEALRRARGEYLMRLDADDYLDESALLVLSRHLDRNPQVGLVYPNWIYVDESGTPIGVELRKRVDAEAEVLDLPAHGACTMVRRRVLKAVGGYDLQHDAQDGHELWIKTLHRFGVGNVQTPLFYYRQHGESLSLDEARILESRRRIKRVAAAGFEGSVRPRVAVIVPVKNDYPGMPNVALDLLAGKPLLDYTLEQATALPAVEVVLVSTADDEVARHCYNWPGARVQRRDPALAEPPAQLPAVIEDAVRHLEQVQHCYADVIVVLSVHTPLRQLEHIQEALDTLLVYDVDQVLSTYEDHDLHFRHDRKGLAALNAGALATVRYEREALYAGNGALQVLWRDFADASRMSTGRVGHIVMSRLESLQAKKPEDRVLLDWLLGAGADTLAASRRRARGA